MTLDELEAEVSGRRMVEYIDLGDDWEFVPDPPNYGVHEDANPEEDDAQYGTAQYDLAYGMEVMALASGICPQCGEQVELNRRLTLKAKDDTLFYDCTHSSNHKYLVTDHHP